MPFWTGVKRASFFFKANSASNTKFKSIVGESVVRISGCLVIKRGKMSNLETVR